MTNYNNKIYKRKAKNTMSYSVILAELNKLVPHYRQYLEQRTYSPYSGSVDEGIKSSTQEAEGKASETAQLNIRGRIIRRSTSRGQRTVRQILKSLSRRRPFITKINRIGLLSKKVHANTRGTLNEYQAQYRAKQLIKQFYGFITETQFKNLNKKRVNMLRHSNQSNVVAPSLIPTTISSNKGGIRDLAKPLISTQHISPLQRGLDIKTKDVSLIGLLERRLDVLVFRLGFAKTIHDAKYLIQTNKIKVNASFIKDPSYLVKVGSRIEAHSWKSYDAYIYHRLLKRLIRPSYLCVLTPSKQMFELFQPQANLKGKRPLNNQSSKGEMIRVYLSNLNRPYLMQRLYSYLYSDPKTTTSPIQINGAEKNNQTSFIPLVGYLLKNPSESQVYLPYQFPIQKLNCLLNK